MQKYIKIYLEYKRNMQKENKIKAKFMFSIAENALFQFLAIEKNQKTEQRRLV